MLALQTYGAHILTTHHAKSLVISRIAHDSFESSSGFVLAGVLLASNRRGSKMIDEQMSL
jgi:hypothetical protein